MAADRRVDGAAARDVARGERQVLALHGARRELPHELGLRGERLRDDQEAARVLVEPMDDARARHATRAAAHDAAARSAACRRGCPRPGCTTRPAGLSSTISASSSCDDRQARSPPARARSRRRRRSTCTTTRSPPRTLRVGAATRRRASRGPRRSTPAGGCARYCGQRVRERGVEALSGRAPERASASAIGGVASGRRSRDACLRRRRSGAPRVGYNRRDFRNVRNRMTACIAGIPFRQARDRARAPRAGRACSRLQRSRSRSPAAACCPR